VVARLFALARPHRAYFGQKDAQQVAVIRRLVKDLGFPLRLVECPTVREPDGLAMSSRNVYLDAADRRAAGVISLALRTAQEAFRGGERDRDAIVRAAVAVIAAEPRAQLDYLELRSDGDLLPQPAGAVSGGRLVTAVRFGAARVVRLLDNMPLVENSESSQS
jgi:pantoate--beta-alanine ligase